MKRQMHLGLFILGTGSHVAGWRYPGAVDSFQDFPAIQQIGRTAERGKFDLIFMGDNLYADAAAHPSYTLRLEPLTMLAALATSTSHIGLGATVSTTYSDPFTVARVFASLDHISNGRAAWNAVTTANPATAANFGITHPDHARRYEMAGEFLDVVKGLWDGWADDAIVADRMSGLYIDPVKLRSIDHDGAFFKVKGPLNIGRSPQGHPIVLQAGGSEAGQQLRIAEEPPAGLWTQTGGRHGAAGRHADRWSHRQGSVREARRAAELRQRQQRARHALRTLRAGHVGV